MAGRGADRGVIPTYGAQYYPSMYDDAEEYVFLISNRDICTPSSAHLFVGITKLIGPSYA